MYLCHPMAAARVVAQAVYTFVIDIIHLCYLRKKLLASAFSNPYTPVCSICTVSRSKVHFSFVPIWVSRGWYPLVFSGQVRHPLDSKQLFVRVFVHICTHLLCMCTHWISMCTHALHVAYTFAMYVYSFCYIFAEYVFSFAEYVTHSPYVAYTFAMYLYKFAHIWYAHMH